MSIDRLTHPITAVTRFVGTIRLASQTTVTAARVVYVAMGDGKSSEGLDCGVPTSQAFPALLARHLSRGAHFLNLATPATALADALGSELPLALNAHPTLVTWFGTADLEVGDTPPAQYRQSLDSFLTALQRTHARVFFGNLPDLRLFQDPDTRSLAETGRAINAVIAAAARRHGAVVVDVYANSKAIWGHPAMVIAGCHDRPTARGEPVLASLFYRVMHRQGAL